MAEPRPEDPAGQRLIDAEILQPGASRGPFGWSVEGAGVLTEDDLWRARASSRHRPDEGWIPLRVFLVNDELRRRGLRIACAKCWTPLDRHGRRHSLVGRIHRRAAQTRYDLGRLVRRIRGG